MKIRPLTRTDFSLSLLCKKEPPSNLLIKAQNTLNFLTFIFYFIIHFFTITHYFQSPKGKFSEE